MTLHEAQEKIAQLNGRLSGSRAFGTPRPNSDWDYYMAERNVKRLRRWLDDRGERWDSPFLGSLTFWPDGVQVEVSYLFPRTKAQHLRQ